jgi:hypothetical protein
MGNNTRRPGLDNKEDCDTARQVQIYPLNT